MATKKATSGTGSVKAKSPSRTAGRTKLPSMEEIRQKASEIYLERVSRGEPGNAEDDWFKAEAFFRGKK